MRSNRTVATNTRESVMAKRKPVWHSGAHQRLARQMNRQADTNPHTVCMGGCTCHARTIDQCVCHQACGKTKREHPATKTGRPIWTAGHRWSGTRCTTLDQYRHEIRGCNSAASNRTRGQATTRDW